MTPWHVGTSLALAFGSEWCSPLVSLCENLIQARRRTFVAFQTRVAKAVMVVDKHRTVVIAVLHEKLDGGDGFLRVLNGTLEPVGIKDGPVDCNDLGTNSQSGLVRGPLPQHVI